MDRVLKVFFCPFTIFTLFIFVLFFTLCVIFRDAYWRPDVNAMYAVWQVQVLCICDQIKRSERNPSNSSHGNLSSWSFTTWSLSFFLHYCNLSWCILTATCTMQFGEGKCAFTIKWKVPNAIQRIHHMVNYCPSLSQLVLYYKYLPFT